MAKATKKVVKRRKERKVVEKGAAHIRSSFNNTMVTITGLEVVMIKDVTPIPHNGCRPPKRRRV